MLTLRSKIGIGTALLALCGCGRISELEPAPGQSLPVKPLLARSTPTPEQLLTPPAYANPERVDEIVRRSEPRRTDRFDLPPPDGGLAPVLPEREDPSSSEKAGPATPDEPGA
jgi:hypothetical protein